jgi:Tol biopolymer transport system component
MLLKLHRRIFTKLFILVIFILCATDTLQATSNQIQLVSVSSGGVPGNSYSDYPSMSADGRFVAFYSQANSLVPNDVNGDYSDVFVHDRQTGQTEIVSVSSTGVQGNGYSYYPSISANGRFVAFSSSSNNLVPNVTNGGEIYVRDRQTGQTEIVSISSSGAPGNDTSNYPSISADGRLIAFESFASNLTPNNTTGKQVFVHDRQTGQTEIVSVSVTGGQGNSYSYDPSISADGRYIVFESSATNLVANDTNRDYQDIFVRDRQLGQTEIASVSSTGVQGNGYSYYPSISANGRFVVFESGAKNLVGGTVPSGEIYIHDRQTGQTEIVSVSSIGVPASAFSHNQSPNVSADGHFVVFDSDATNLVPIDTNNRADSFVHNRQTGQTEIVSVSDTGEQGNGGGTASFLSADGRFIAFQSGSTNLVDATYLGGADNIFETLNILAPPLSSINAFPVRNYYRVLPLTLTWTPVSWATAYEIQIAQNSGFAPTLSYSAMIPGDKLQAVINTLQNGTYFWHVRAVGGSGTWSPTDQFVLDVP